MGTLMLANGENAKVVSERLGHSTIVLTLDTYRHVLPDISNKPLGESNHYYSKRRVKSLMSFKA